MAPGYDKCLSSGVNRVIDHHLSLVSGQQEILRRKNTILTITPEKIFERQSIFCSHPYGPRLRLWKCFCSRIVAGALVRYTLPCIAKVPLRIYNTLLILCLSGDFKNLFRSTPGPFGLVSPNFGKGHCLASAGLMFFLQFQFTFHKSSFTLISRNMAPIKNCSAYTRTIFGLFLLEIPACCICSHQGWQWALRTNQKHGPSSDIVDFPINSGVNKLIFL